MWSCIRSSGGGDIGGAGEEGETWRSKPSGEEKAGVLAARVGGAWSLNGEAVVLLVGEVKLVPEAPTSAAE